MYVYVLFCLFQLISSGILFQLPDLNRHQIQDYQSLWIQLTLITSTNNCKEKHLIHPNNLEYHDPDASENNHASVRIRLTQRDILEGVKK